MTKGCYRLIVLKKSVCPKRSNIDGGKHLFCTLLREIRVLNLLRKAQISISGAYLSVVETEADFFNTIGQKQTLTFEFRQSRMQRAVTRVYARYPTYRHRPPPHTLLIDSKIKHDLLGISFPIRSCYFHQTSLGLSSLYTQISWRTLTT